MPKPDPKDAPTLENYPTLAKWLADANGARLSRTEVGKVGGVTMQALEVWNFRALNGDLRQAVIMLRAHRHGWDIFTPGSSIRTDSTLVDAEARLGLMREVHTVACVRREREIAELLGISQEPSLKKEARDLGNEIDDKSDRNVDDGRWSPTCERMPGERR